MFPRHRKHRKTKGRAKPDASVPTLEQTDKAIETLKKIRISRTLADNEAHLKAWFKDCSDVVMRKFEIEKGIPALAVCIDGLVDTASLNDAMYALMIGEKSDKNVARINMEALPVSQFQKTGNFGDFIISVLGGDTGVLVEDNDEAMLLGIRGPKTRSISEPETEAVVRGPREGFIENLRVNTALLRRRIRSPQLKLKSMTLGARTNTGIVIAYMEGICSPSLLEEAEKRLSRIDIDAIMESGYIEELIQDSTYSPFPQVQYTERPDTTAAALLQGRIAIITDGTPFVLLAPTVFWNFMQSNEDYYERFEIATLIRWLRYLFLFLSLLTPALYVAILTFHQDMLPTSLLLSIATARESIPFPVLVEALLMEVTFEALREAGIRLPKTVGQAVSILGALVVGQAAVQAGIVSAPMVIVVAITGIASFTIPRFNAAISVRMLRFPLMIAAGLFGMYGVLLVMMLIIGHMAGLRSFGVPYLSPTGPMSWGDLNDVAIRSPIWMMDRRPSYTSTEDAERVGDEVQREQMKQQGQKGKDIDHKHGWEEMEGADLGQDNRDGDGGKDA